MTKEIMECHERMEFTKELNRIRASEAAMRIHRAKILGHAANIIGRNLRKRFPSQKVEHIHWYCYWETRNWAEDLRIEAHELLKQCDVSTLERKYDTFYSNSSLDDKGGRNGKCKN